MMRLHPIHLAPLALTLAACAATDGSALSRRAHQAEAAGQWDVAVEAWNDVLAIRGEGDREATLGYARALLETDQVALAALVLERAIDRTPRREQAELWLGLAALRARTGDQVGEMEAWDGALGSDPQRAEAHVGRARRLWADDGPEAAARALAPALAMPTALPEALALALELARATGDEAAELRALRGRLDAGPAPVAELVRAAELARAPEDADDRISWLTSATSLDPQHQRAHRMLGETLLEAGDAVAADGPLSRAAELDPGDAASLEALVRCLRATGQDGRASGVIEHALRVLPEAEHERFRSLTVE